MLPVPAHVYHPMIFFFITILISLALGPVAVLLSREKNKFLLPFLLFGLSVPSIVAIAMIYASQNEALIADFWERLFLFKISPIYLLFILLLMPCVAFLATLISLFFGYSKEQFLITTQFSVMKGWAIFGIAIPLILAPIIEEIGWRGYGVDALKAYFNLFTTSLLFGLLWSIWHLPTFFIKGYYQNTLIDLGMIYVINFFVSVFVVAFLMNWIYYKTDRSIPAVILFHSLLNLFSMLFRTEAFTKCIATVILFIVSVIIIFFDSAFFIN